MSIINRSLSNNIIWITTCIPETAIVIDSYGTLQEANIYFDNRLRSQPWKRSSIFDRSKALIEATRIIDGLKYKGDKTDEDQLHQFPRDAETDVPKNIEFATYEIALKLLDGVDPEIEQENLYATGSNYGGVRTTYDRTFLPVHIQAGVPSMKAWSFLRPFLSDPQEITISRVS